MKKILKTIEKFFGEIILMIGTGIFFYNIFNIFTFNRFTRPFRTLKGYAYYYNQDILLLISIGAMLIVAGILIIRNKK